MGVGVFSVAVGSGVGLTGGTGREVNGGGGGTVKGGGAGTFAGSTFTLSSGTPLSRTPLFSSGFQSSSGGNRMDCDQLGIPTNERYKVGA